MKRHRRMWCSSQESMWDTPKVTNFDAMKLNKELQFADELTDGIMVSMIHNMDENDIEITDSGFIQDIAFLSEAIKATIYRDRDLLILFKI